MRHPFFENREEMFPAFFSKYMFIVDEYLDGIKFNLDSVYGYVYQKIFMLAIRTLISELHDYKNNGWLKGYNSQERYSDFEYIAGNDKFQRLFVKKYPLLDEAIQIKITNTCSFVKSILECFDNDKLIIQKKINKDIEEIVEVIIGHGDTHNQGKSVVILKTNCGKLVFKPHSLVGDCIWECTINWINNRQLESNLRTLKFIDKKDYGWQEFVEADGEMSKEVAEKYFYRCGSCLAIFYALGATDMHFENIIVSHGYPLFIDLETLINVPRHISFSTVLETNFIPNIQNDLVYDFDFSGLCGSGNIKSKIKTITIINPKTDEMAIQNVECNINENNNGVYINGERANIEDFEENVKLGFNDTIHIIKRNKHEFKDLLDNNIHSNSLFRQVIRATQVYSKYLTAATHPYYLQNKDNREELFSKLYANLSEQKDKVRVEMEIEQLEMLDVPYFTVGYESRDLISGNRKICNDYFNYTIREALLNRIDRITDFSINIQNNIISKSLLTAYKDQFVEKNSIEEYFEYEDYPRIVSDKIMDSIISDNTGSILIINTLVGDRFRLSNLNVDLYEGGGLIWFLACSGRYYNNKSYTKQALKLLNTAEMYYQYKDRQKISSQNVERLAAFSGIGSCLYNYYNLWILTEDEALFERFSDICNKIEKLDLSYLDSSNETKDFDYVCGIAGFIVVACKILEQKKNKTLLKIVSDLDKKLIAYIKRNSNFEFGMAHGISGIVYALLMLNKINISGNYKEIIYNLLTQEMKLFTDASYKTYSWCKGATGMALVRAVSLAEMKEERFYKEILHIYDLVYNSELIPQNGLCHGSRGIKEGFDDVKRILASCGKNITNNRITCIKEKNDFGLKNNKDIETFMLGSSGVAYSLLREKNRIFPSLLLLEVMKK